MISARVLQNVSNGACCYIMDTSAVVYIHKNYRWHFGVYYKQNNEFEYTDILEKTKHFWNYFLKR